MTTTLERLVTYPHAAVFDKAPGAELALRLRHPDGAAWVIADEVMSVTVDDVTWDYDLSQHTVVSLAGALEADGFEVLAVSTELATRGAAVLIEGKGDQAESNGDHIYAYTSLMWALMGGYAVEVREAEKQVANALRQMVITQAEGEWLDLWGMLYAVDRIEGESDADYAPRIPEEAFRLRVNGLAIEKAIKDITGKTVEIREPWRKMFTLNESQLSGVDHLPDAHYYGYFLIHPVAREAFDWEDVLEVINRNRAAGIEVYFPAVEFPVNHVLVEPGEYQVSMGRQDIHSSIAYVSGEAPLGVMRLSDNDIVLNHPMSSFHLHGISNAEGVGMDGSEKIIDPRDIARAAIVLSDGAPLGDENAILSRGVESLSFDPPKTLSDELAPSEHSVVRNVERVEMVTIDARAAAVNYPIDLMSVTMMLTDDESHQASAAWDVGEFAVSMSVTHHTAGGLLDTDFYMDLSILDSDEVDDE